MNISHTILIAVAGAGLFAGAVRAQDTNCCPIPPQTKLEGFDTNTGIVVLRATAQIGTVAANAGTLSVKCRAITDIASGRRELGLALGIAPGNQPEHNALIDYDELDSLLNALDYLSKVDWTATTLQSFDAVYTSKGGFRIGAYGSRRTGGIEFGARNLRAGQVPVPLSRDQVGQLRGLIDQARAKLDSLRQEK